MWRLFILFALLAAWCCPLAAQQPLGRAMVMARMAPDGVRATITLDRAVSRFDFKEASVVREGDFEILTPGLRLADRSVTGERPFRRFELRIRPMSHERDARYPAHFRIGDGGVLYGPALVADPAKWRTRLSFKLGRGQVRSPSGKEFSDGFVFVGPRSLVSEDPHIVVVADPKTPAWLVERSRNSLTAAVATFTRALGTAPLRKPLLIVKHEPGERSFNVGDVTPGPVAAVRFHGSAWEKEDALAGKNIQGFLLHEAFHFWNGGLASHAAGTPTWLHEGGAEYAAFLAGVQTGLMTEEEAARGLGNALNRCRTGLSASGDKGLASFGFLPAQLRYPCGMAIQWIADLDVRAESGGRRTVLDVWREVLERARQREARTYSLADFNEAAGLAGAQASEPIRLLVDESGAARWEALPAALNAMGADVALVPSQVARRAALIFHVLKDNCRNLPDGTGYGFYIDGSRMKLDGPEGCGVLAGDPEVASIEGGDPVEMTLETYAAVQRKCATGGKVTFLARDGGKLQAPCTTPLPAPPKDFQVRRWKPEPARVR